jgi:GAF domain-containing protein
VPRGLGECTTAGPGPTKPRRARTVLIRWAGSGAGSGFGGHAGLGDLGSELTELLDALRTFTREIVNPYDPQELLHRLTDQAVTLTRSRSAGVMLAGHKGLGFAAASDDDAVEIELVQDRIQAGPCYDAFTTNHRQAVADLRGTTTWGEYRDRALALGSRSVLGVPLHAAGQTIGVLNVYRTDAGTWGQGDIDAAEVLASMAAAYVMHASRSRSQNDLAEQLQYALEGRDLIGQAKGILIARHGLSADEAFEALRVCSQNTNTKLRDVAEKLVASQLARRS